MYGLCLILRKNTLPPTQHIETIKNFCRSLEEYNISEVVATYDGSGDSGDMDISFKHNVHVLPIGNSAATTHSTWLPENEVERMLTPVGGGTICKKTFDEFINALWGILPGGWEIDDGAYGEINVNVSEKTVFVTHSERYTEVTTTENTY